MNKDQFAYLNERVITLEGRIVAHLETIRWMAQTVHQAYHQEHAGAFMTCKKSVCDAARQEIENAPHDHT